MTQVVYRAYQGLAYVILAGLLLQFFFAGLGVFSETEDAWGAHVIVGQILVLLSLILLVLAGISALTGGFARGRVVGLTALFLVLMIVQMELVDLFGDSVPVIAALHPVNGLILLFLAHTLARGRGAPEAETATASRVR